MIKKIKIEDLFEFIDYRKINYYYNLRDNKKFGSSFITKNPRIDFIKNATLEELSDEDREVFKLAIREGYAVPKREYREKLLKFFFEGEII